MFIGEYFDIVDENGEEHVMEVMFTFDSPDGISYVLFRDPLNEEEIYAYRYDDDGNLIGLETDEEWEMCEEMLNTVDLEL